MLVFCTNPSVTRGQDCLRKRPATLTRRSALATGAATAATAFFGPLRSSSYPAHAGERPLRLGLTVDLEGVYRSEGISEERGIKMAVAEANAGGGVLGRPVETVTISTQSDAKFAAPAAEELIGEERVAFMLGGINSAVAKILSEVAQANGVIYMNTNSSAPSESGKNCHRTKFVWDASGAIFGNAIVRHAMRWLGKDWFLLASDYSWGIETAEAIRRLVKANNGRIIGEKYVPLGTTEFRPIVRDITNHDPNVVFTAISAVDLEYLRHQIADSDLVGLRPAWIASQQDWPEISRTGAKSTFGLFPTTWYHKLDLPGVADFVQRYRAAYPGASIPVPGNVFYNAYMATRELLRVIEELGTTNNIAIIKALEGRRMPARDRMQHEDAWIDPTGHRVQQTVYIATRNPSPADDTDLFSIISHQRPGEIASPDTTQTCALEPFDSIPSFDP